MYLPFKVLGPPFILWDPRVFLSSPFLMLITGFVNFGSITPEVPTSICRSSYRSCIHRKSFYGEPSIITVEGVVDGPSNSFTFSRLSSLPTIEWFYIQEVVWAPINIGKVYFMFFNSPGVSVFINTKIISN